MSDHSTIDPAQANASPTDVSSDAAADGKTIARLPSADRAEALRIIEARLFASSNPLSSKELQTLLPEGADVAALVEDLRGLYAGRGVNLVNVGADQWMFHTAEDLAYVMQRVVHEERRLSKAALETLAIIAYHQPTTRADIEDIRGVATSKGTLDVLMDHGWIKPRGRRRAPGRPVTYGTTDAFLTQFTLESLNDLPGLNELKGAGLLSANLPPDFEVPEPKAVADLMPDELPLEEGDADESVADLFDDDPEGAV
ncbi:MAG: SMC-Scp complex subunit ScpB, partial [Pseudomonadota bacterium]